VLQRTQAYEKPIGCRPTQLPGCTVIVASTNGCPVAIGMDVFTGGPTTSAVGSTLVREPSLFVAVTRTRSRNPTSKPVRT
jgi:hypothetical protein